MKTRVQAALISLLLTAATPARVLAALADANCDSLSSAADVVAAVTVAQDTFAFPDCRGADQFRNHQFTPEGQERLLNDIFNRQEQTWTPTPTTTPTRTPAATRTPSATATASVTATASATNTPTLTPTNTPRPTNTRTATRTATDTPTRTATPTATPTGLAQQLAGDWSADWANGALACCYLIGQSQPLCIADAVYRVTAAPSNQLTITNLTSGQALGTATITSGGTVHPPLVTENAGICNVDGQPIVMQFDYTFTFNVNGTGSATIEWKRLTHCQTCDQRDTATLQRVARP
ncbi:MAG: hypothetical protein HY699_15010 [Deltaproteobacteria bacterium]|nr:hypothetical protein [Deltaproteobacteria bacterium]